MAYKIKIKVKWLQNFVLFYFTIYIYIYIIYNMCIILYYYIYYLFFHISQKLLCMICFFLLISLDKYRGNALSVMWYLD